MPARIGRLKQRSEFLAVAAARNKWVAPGLILQAQRSILEAIEEDSLRVGYTVSKKVGNSVKRNRARRRLRAVTNQTFPAHAATGMDYVMIGRRQTLNRPFNDLRSDLENALQHLRLWRGGTAL